MYLPLFEKLEKLIELMKSKGYSVVLSSGTRTFEEQAKLYNQGRTTHGEIVTNAKPGYSWHNYGLAGDLCFVINNKPSWDDHLPWLKMGELGEGLGLEWGGRWGEMMDRPHFQITRGVPIEHALKIYRKRNSVYDVWQFIERN